jgi:hypothetical protein
MVSIGKLISVCFLREVDYHDVAEEGLELSSMEYESTVLPTKLFRQNTTKGRYKITGPEL